jgi:hypothetical protein
MHLTLRTITAELQRLDPELNLKRGDAYYYFSGGVADTWLESYREGGEARFVHAGAVGGGVRETKEVG